MTVKEFNKLDEIIQAEILGCDGVQIANRHDAVYLYVLYQLHAFYIEVWYHKEFEVVYKFISFESTDELEPYLEQIDIYPLDS